MYNTESKENIHSVGNQQSRMKCIRCTECGAEILMVPTLWKMVEAIENHAKLHRKQPTADLLVTDLRKPSIRADLTEQVLQKASDWMETLQKHLLCG